MSDEPFDSEEFDRWRENLSRVSSQQDQVQAVLREDEEVLDVLQEAVTQVCRLQHLLEERAGIHPVHAFGYMSSLIQASLLRDILARDVTLEDFDE